MQEGCCAFLRAGKTKKQLHNKVLFQMMGRILVNQIIVVAVGTSLRIVLLSVAIRKEDNGLLRQKGQSR